MIELSKKENIDPKKSSRSAWKRRIHLPHFAGHEPKIGLEGNSASSFQASVALADRKVAWLHSPTKR
jgi:hypothetical protein